MSEDNIIDTIEDVAKRFGKTVRTVYRWMSQGMPVRPDGRFDMEAIMIWRKRKKGVLGSAPQEGGSGVQEPGEGMEEPGGKDWWDAKSKKFQAGLRELDYRKKKGELIELRQVESLFVARIQAVKQALLVLERSLPPDLIACRTEREMSGVIHKAVRGILDAFARPLPPSMQPALEPGTEDDGSR